MDDAPRKLDDVTLEELAEILEADAASLREDASVLNAQAEALDTQREQFIADVAKPIQRLREAAGLPRSDG